MLSGGCQGWLVGRIPGIFFPLVDEESLIAGSFMKIIQDMSELSSVGERRCTRFQTKDESEKNTLLIDSYLSPEP